MSTPKLNQKIRQRQNICSFSTRYELDCNLAIFSGLPLPPLRANTPHTYLCYSDSVCIVPNQSHEEHPIRSEVALDELLTVPLVLVRLDFTRHLQVILDVAEKRKKTLSIETDFIFSWFQHVETILDQCDPLHIEFNNIHLLKIALIGVYPTEHLSLIPLLKKF